MSLKKILIDINHPAHVHLFSNFARIMKELGYEILFTTRDKEVSIDLLKAYSLNFVSFGKHKKDLFNKIKGLFEFNFKLLKTALKFKPDLFLSMGSIYAAQVSFLINKPHIALDDTEHASEHHILYKPFSKTLLNPSCFKKDFGSKQICYEGYHELAYLHPNYFIPNKDIHNLLGINKNESYVILRFVSWEASHDKGHGGFTPEFKFHLVEELSKQKKLFISSESPLPAKLKKFQINIPPIKMLDALAYANLFIGEGATMASECAMLGTPAIYVNTLSAGTLEEQKKYGLIVKTTDSDKIMEEALNILSNSESKNIFQKKRYRMLAEKIDVTAFMVWFIENYPESVQTLKDNPDYQYKFK